MAGEELEVWAALVVGAGPEPRGRLAGAAWAAALKTEPGVLLQGALLEVVQRGGGLREETEELKLKVNTSHQKRSRAEHVLRYPEAGQSV